MLASHEGREMIDMFHNQRRLSNLINAVALFTGIFILAAARVDGIIALVTVADKLKTLDEFGARVCGHVAEFKASWELDISQSQGNAIENTAEVNYSPSEKVSRGWFGAVEVL